MATNVHDFEEVWHYYGQKPTVYYGWGITASSYTMSCAHFDSREARDKFYADVQALLPGNVRGDLVAACLLIDRMNGDTDRQSARFLLEEAFDDDEKKIDEFDARVEAVLEKHFP